MGNDSSEQDDAKVGDGALQGTDRHTMKRWKKRERRLSLSNKKCSSRRTEPLADDWRWVALRYTTLHCDAYTLTLT